MFSNKKSLVFVTGASRGLGRSIVMSLAEEVGDGSNFVLLARTKEDLEETCRLIDESFAEKKLKIFVKSVDNQTADKEVYDRCLEDVTDDDFDAFILVHNAGSLGPHGTPVRNLFDRPEMQNYFSANIFSVMMLNAAFMEKADKQTKASSIVIINISSLAGLQPFETWSFYCMGKAARDMLFRVMAVEEKNENLRILNYAPGPLDTAMVQDVLTSSQTNPQIRKSMEDMKTNGILLSPDESAKKLIKVLKKNDFKNGDHVDYFDDVD